VVISTLRIIALANAAVWLGAAVLHALVMQPALRGVELTALLGPLYAGATADVLAGRFHVLGWLCLAVALLAAGAEWLYAGRPLDRWTAWLLGGLLVLQAADAWMVQPRVRPLLVRAYVSAAGQPQRQAWTAAQMTAARRLRWHAGVSAGLQGAAVLLLAGQVWQTAMALSSTRFNPRMRLKV
jgi:hypothetical protein